VAKSIIHVGVAVSTDGVIPGRDNIIGISACVGPDFVFNQNVLPANGKYHKSPFWTKHPEEFRELLQAPRSLTESIKLFDTWLKSWQGRMVACCSIIDFWHLFTAMMEYAKGCPFGTLPLDAASYYCGMQGTKAPGKITDQIRPVEVAKERWKMVTAGAMPEFGVKPKAKAPKATGTIRYREYVPTPPAPTPIQWDIADFPVRGQAAQGALNLTTPRTR
jgi:hypothetical protein